MQIQEKRNTEHPETFHGTQYFFLGGPAQVNHMLSLQLSFVIEILCQTHHHAGLPSKSSRSHPPSPFTLVKASGALRNPVPPEVVHSLCGHPPTPFLFTFAAYPTLDSSYTLISNMRCWWQNNKIRLSDLTQMPKPTNPPHPMPPPTLRRLFTDALW